MRVRSADGKSSDKNFFRIALAENSPGTGCGSLTIGPANETSIGYQSSTGEALPAAPNGLRLPNGTAAYQDFRLVFTRASGDLPGGFLKLEAFYYDTKRETYLPLGSAAGAHVSTGIFNRLDLLIGGAAGQASCDSVMVTQVGSPRATSPGNAIRLPFPLPDGVTIQSALDANSTVVLDRGDYSAREPFTLKTGQKLYGDPAGTVIPAVTIEPGAKGVVLSTVNVAGAVTFPSAAAAVTSGCVFERLSCGLVVDGGILEDNLFLHLNAGIHLKSG